MILDSHEALYHNITLERYHAMIVSPSFSNVRRKWLTKFNKRNPFNDLPQWLAFEAKWTNLYQDEYGLLQEDLKCLSRSFSLSEWQILWGLFIKGYYPNSRATTAFPTDLHHPSSFIRVNQLDINLVNDLTQALSMTNIRLILDTSYLDGRKDSSKDNLDINLELPMEIPIRHAVRMARTTRTQSIEILDNFLGKENPLPSNNRSSTFLICHDNTSSFLEKVNLAASKVGLNVLLENIPTNGKIAPNPFADLRILISFSRFSQSADVIRTTRQSIHQGRAVMEALGIRIGERLRHAPTTLQASALNVTGSRLPIRGIGDLIFDHTATFPIEYEKSGSDVRKLRSSIKSRRNQILQRFKRKGLTN